MGYSTQRWGECKGGNMSGTCFPKCLQFRLLSYFKYMVAMPRYMIKAGEFIGLAHWQILRDFACLAFLREATNWGKTGGVPPKFWAPTLMEIAPPIRFNLYWVSGGTIPPMQNPLPNPGFFSLLYTFHRTGIGMLTTERWSCFWHESSSVKWHLCWFQNLMFYLRSWRKLRWKLKIGGLVKDRRFSIDQMIK